MKTYKRKPGRPKGSYTQTLQERLESKFIRRGPDECWLWTGCTDPQGYGRIGPGGRGVSPDRAHRIAYKIYVGPIPWKACVLHKCDNPPCVNPAHLWLGTVQENAADMVQKGRQQQGERSGKAKLTATDVAHIRLAAAQGPRGIQKDLARKFGISRAQVCAIVRGKKWRLSIVE